MWIFFGQVYLWERNGGYPTCSQHMTVVSHKVALPDQAGSPQLRVFFGTNVVIPRET